MMMRGRNICKETPILCGYKSRRQKEKKNTEVAMQSIKRKRGIKKRTINRNTQKLFSEPNPLWRLPNP
jgi:hypothetical protein